VAWQTITFVVSGDVAEAVSDALLEAGAVSVDLADDRAGSSSEQALFGEPGASLRPWPAVRLTALVGASADAATIAKTAFVSAGLEPAPAIKRGQLEDADWIRLTREQFRPIRISERLWVVPSWHAAPDPSAVNVVLDPGVAFGTGSHPTTRLCLEWLVQQIKGGERVLDYGCGSGILAIAAAKLGARTATGVDIDPQAVLAASGNAAQNRIDARFLGPDALAPGEFEIVAANILANPLKALAPLLTGRVRRGGHLILSGVLEAQAVDVAASFAPTVPLLPVAVSEGWVLLTGRRPA
jgi:ribosomal protein L11 methyltransferase